MMTPHLILHERAKIQFRSRVLDIQELIESDGDKNTLLMYAARLVYELSTANYTEVKGKKS